MEHDVLLNIWSVAWSNAVWGVIIGVMLAVLANIKH